MLLVGAIIGIVALLIVLGYIYRKELKQLYETHGKKLIAVALASSMAAGGLFGIPRDEFFIEDYLIDSLEDWEALGFNLSYVDDPIIYKEHVLCEGHLPLAFEFKTLSKDYDLKADIFKLSTIIKEGTYKNLNFNINVLTLAPMDLDNPIQAMSWDTEYEWVWQDINEVSNKQIRQGDILVIDIVGHFEAGLEKKSIDVIPTLNLGSYKRTYTEYSWWNANWGHRKLITWNTSYIEDSFADWNGFHCLVHLETDSDLAAYAQDDGDDITFVDYADNSTQFDHELEHFDGTDGELIAWVRDTDMSTTKVWMYFNNSACGSQEDATNTWDNIFANDPVWHFSDDTDSCASWDWDTTQGESIVNSECYKAFDLEESQNDYCQLDDFAANIAGAFLDSFYVYIWFKAEGISSSYDLLFRWQHDASNLIRIILDDDYTGDVQLRAESKGTNNNREGVVGDFDVTENSANYEFISLRFNEKESDAPLDRIEGSFNGYYVIDDANNNYMETDTATETLIGVFGNCFDGCVDEMRIFYGTEFLKIEYDNMTYYTLQYDFDGGFFSLGADEVPLVIEAPQVTNASTDTANCSCINMTATLDEDGNESCNCWFEWGFTDSYGNRSVNQSLTEVTDFYYENCTFDPCSSIHWRAAVNNSNSTVYTSDQWVNLSCWNTTTNSSTAPCNNTTLILYGYFNSTCIDGTATAGFEYGTTAAYGSSQASAHSPGVFSETITGLTGCTLYHYRAYVTEDGVTNYGEDRTAYTQCCPYITYVSPTDGEADVTYPVTVTVNVSDNNSDTMTVQFLDGGTTGASYELEQTNNSVATGTNLTWDFTDAYISGETYYWRIWINTTCCNRSYDFSFDLENFVGTYVNNADISYWCWLNSSCTLEDVAENLTGFDEASEWVAVWDANQAWDDDDWCWIKYYGDDTGSGTQTVNQFDVIYSYLTDSGVQVVKPVPEPSECCPKNIELDYKGVNGNKGYNYTCYCINASDYSLTLKSIAQGIPLQTGEVLAYWDTATWEWRAWIEGITPDALNVNINRDWIVFETKVHTDVTWSITCP